VQVKLRNAAEWLRNERATTVGISGMALGVDQWWAQAVLAAGLKLWAYIPSAHQGDRWTPDQGREWGALIEQATKVHTFGGRQVTPALLHARNDGMLDDSDAVIAVYRPGKTTGGTYSAVMKAERRRMPGIFLDPVARSVSLGLPDLGARSVVGSPS
jgi:uncharacterized phage-like protein YoqJ